MISPATELFDGFDFDGDELFEDDYLRMSPVKRLVIGGMQHLLAKLEEIHDYLDDIPEMGKVLSVASGIKLARMINDDNDLNDLRVGLV